MLSPVLKIFSNSNKYYCLIELEIKTTTEPLTSSASHIETKVSAIKSTQHPLEVITPVNASSLYWLI